MKSNEEIISVIHNKIEEHKLEITGSDKAMAQLQIGMKSKTNRPDFNNLTRLGILKDKIIFHKSIVLAFIDLLEEID